MKKLLIIRHAKSSWDPSVLNDFDRPLNNRGETNAPIMAKRLSKRKVKIDAFVSSPAKRALSTAQYFAEAYGKKLKHIVQIPSLYHAGVPIFKNVIEQLHDNDSCVAIFSHNPGITDFVNELTSVKIDNMPTCGVFAVDVDIDHWKDFESAKKVFWFFDYPKSAL